MARKVPMATQIKITNDVNEWIEEMKAGASKQAFINNLFELVKDKIEYNKKGQLIIKGGK